MEIPKGFEVVWRKFGLRIKVKKNLFGQVEFEIKIWLTRWKVWVLSRVSLMNAFSVKAVLCSYCTLMIQYMWDPTITNLR
jgi:hypothetical protein